jgi:hypothetical protein
MRLRLLYILIAAPLAFGQGPVRGPLQLSMKRAVELATSPEGNTRVQLSG